MNATTQVLWVTGAGSGMGRAIAVAAAAAGRTVALSGRRAEALAATAKLIVAAGGKTPLQLALDVRDADALAEAHAGIKTKLGTVNELVLAAGLNTPQRTWADQSMTTFAVIIETNLVSAARAIDLVLPGMRATGGGTIVAISSIAAWRLSPAAGVAYTASKRGLKSLTESINGQEGAHGIRATLVLPGDVDSEFLAQRPEVPDAIVRARMLSAGDIARAVQFVLDSPSIVCIDELVISPTGF
jgi:NADP-dependent 3-hydroxy acid dehydrogenase YdfG